MKIANVNDLYETLSTIYLRRIFQITVLNSIKDTNATHSQFNLPGLNLSGNLETPTLQGQVNGPSKSACGAIAAYATYFQMRQNLSPEDSPSPPLEDLIYLGTSRYQALQRQLELEPQLKNLKAAVGAHSTEYKQLQKEVIGNVDRERKYLHPEDIFSEIGFAKLFTFNPAHILQTNLKIDSHNQYTTLLEALAKQMPETDPINCANQIGAIFSKASSFSSIVITQTNNAPNAYSITFTDSHGSWNPLHFNHYNKAFQITFSSLKDAGRFLSIHAPYYSNNSTSHQVDTKNIITFYPVSLKPESERATTQLIEDTQYVSKVKATIKQTQSNQKKRKSTNRPPLLDIQPHGKKLKGKKPYHFEYVRV